MGNIESLVSHNPAALKAARAMIDESAKIIKDGAVMNQSGRKILHSYLANIIPILLQQERTNGVEKAFVDKEKWKALIEWPLGYFICGEDPEIGLAKIKELDTAPKVCGKLFDIGDPTYTCKYVVIHQLHCLSRLKASQYGIVDFLDILTQVSFARTWFFQVLASKFYLLSPNGHIVNQP